MTVKQTAFITCLFASLLFLATFVTFGVTLCIKPLTDQQFYRFVFFMACEWLFILVSYIIVYYEEIR